MGLSCALWTSSAVAAPAASDDPVALFERARYLEAAAAFEVEYTRTGDPAMLFGQATALRRAGDCAGSIEAFESFIATDPPQPDVEEARRVIDTCRAILDAARPPQPPPPIPPSPAESIEPDPANEPVEEGPSERPAWRRDVTGGALLGSGLTISVGGAAVLGIGAARTQPRQESETGFERRRDSVRTLYVVGGSMIAVGSALLIGSIVRYAIVARRARR